MPPPDDDNPNQAIQDPAVQVPPAGNENSTLPFMQDLLAQTARTPEEKRRVEQLASAVTLAEQYYNAKAAELNPRGKRATARVREALLERVDASLGLELNKKDAIEHSGSNGLEYEVVVCKFAVANQQASFAAISNMAIGDYKSATMWMLTAHHLARVIAGDAQQRRKVELMPEQFKSILGKQSGPVAVLGSQSKKKLAENIKTIKLIPTKGKDIAPLAAAQVQTVAQAPVSTTLQQQLPSQLPGQQQQIPIQIVPFMQPFTFQSTGRILL
ncbi:MAG: hypothetical protein EZS28_029342 [Streblomastix strix]|uniref:Uncharacterized protein n=1 Tax=Streblomastix strix TaxID=222440 RepID=A0A5J4UYF0_9EUKA|nr:MAG: hypothetical protein EZS28_029342 [Streblomastix strix]